MSEANKTFDANLPVINDIVMMAQRMAGAGRNNTSVLELSERLRRPLSEIFRVFEILGVQVASYHEPSLYELNAIIEAGTRHEVGNRSFTA